MCICSNFLGHLMIPLDSIKMFKDEHNSLSSLDESSESEDGVSQVAKPPPLLPPGERRRPPPYHHMRRHSTLHALPVSAANVITSELNPGSYLTMARWRRPRSRDPDGARHGLPAVEWSRRHLATIVVAGVRVVGLGPQHVSFGELFFFLHVIPRGQGRFKS